MVIVILLAVTWDPRLIILGHPVTRNPLFERLSGKDREALI